MNTGTHFAELFCSRSGNDIESLEKMVNNQPVSALSRFLILYQLKKNNDPGFEKSLHKTALYFNNPNWLQFQLEQTPLEKESISSINETTEETSHFAIVIPEERNELKEDIMPFESPAEITESKEPEESIINLTEEKLKEEIIPLATVNEKMEVLQTGDEIESTTSKEEEPFAFEPKEEMLETDQLSNVAPFENRTEEPLAFEPKEEMLETDQLSNEAPFENRTEEPLAFEPKEDMLETDQLSNEAPFENRTEESLAFEPKEEMLEINQLSNEAPFENRTEEPLAFEPKEESISFEPQIQPSTINEEEEPMAFEPLHTVDYFASQGIKINEEALMNDKLGNQVKSFTAWLKSMKKLHPGKLPEQNEVIEKIIQSSAEESNADADVLTESMAEVLIKQDKREKAVAMYQKLSLMNPSKSAYFAAKIESIKTN